MTTYPEHPERLSIEQQEPHEYRTRQRVTFYQSSKSNIVAFGYYLVASGVGRVYHVRPTGRVVVSVLERPLPYQQITRAEFDKLLARYVLPPVFDDAPPE